MQDLEKLARELQRQGKAEGLRTLAESEDGKKLGRMIDAKALEKALQGGDSAALRKLLHGALRSAEGQRLAENLRSMLGK